MTVILATSWGGSAAIVSDSAGTDVWGNQEDCGSKLRDYSFGVVGFSGTFALLTFIDEVLKKCDRLETPRQAQKLGKDIFDACRELGGAADGAKSFPKNQDLQLLLLSTGGKIWRLQPDFAVLRSRRIGAIGCGFMTATGAAEALRKNCTELSPAVVAEEAVRITCSLSAHCGGRLHTRRVEA